MSRDVTLPMRRKVYASETGEAFITLLTIEHAALNPPIRVCDNDVALPSNGETFVAYSFQVTWPKDRKNQATLAQIRIGNVDRKIIETLRPLVSAVTVTTQVVRASAPNVVEAELPDFELTKADYDGLLVQGDLNLESFANEPYPFQSFTPATHQGMF